MTLPEVNRQIVLRQRPVGLLGDDDVELVESPLPQLQDGEALLEVEYLGIDATVRTWLSQAEGYMPPVGFGEVVRSSGIGTVVASRCDTLPVGGPVYSLPGWQEYAVIRDDFLSTPLEPDADKLGLIAIYGATGLTAYIGLFDIGNVQPGETVVVSAAAGATGSLAAQIAKIHGCRVVGICGSDEKASWLLDDLGLDGVVNYRTESVPERLRELCPNRIDVYFDNVGGEVLDAALGRLAQGGRVVLCGAISIYTATQRPPGPRNYFQLINRRGRMQGFLSMDYWDRLPEVRAQLATWVAEGKLTWRTHLFQGLAAAPDALNAMFEGTNIGKIVVKL